MIRKKNSLYKRSSGIKKHIRINSAIINNIYQVLILIRNNILLLQENHTLWARNEILQKDLQKQKTFTTKIHGKTQPMNHKHPEIIYRSG